MRDPVRAYVDSARRGELSDVADTALRRMARDIRTALPNSLRVSTSGSTFYLELLQTGPAVATVPKKTTHLLAMSCFFPPPIPPSTRWVRLVRSRARLWSTAIFWSCTTCLLLRRRRRAMPTLTTPRLSRETMSSVSTTAAAAFQRNKMRFLSPAAVASYAISAPISRQPFPRREWPVTYVCAPGAADASGNGTGRLERMSATPLHCSTPARGGHGSDAGGQRHRLQYPVRPVGPHAESRMVSIQLSITRGGETVSLYMKFMSAMFRNAGFAAIAAIFILVVLAGLGWCW